MDGARNQAEERGLERRNATGNRIEGIRVGQHGLWASYLWANLYSNNIMLEPRIMLLVLLMLLV